MGITSPEAGAARFIGGIYQLVVLAFGLVASEAAFDLTSPTYPVASTAQVGAWAPLVGVGVYIVGIWLAFSAPLTALPALLIDRGLCGMGDPTVG